MAELGLCSNRNAAGFVMMEQMIRLTPYLNTIKLAEATLLTVMKPESCSLPLVHLIFAH